MIAGYLSFCQLSGSTKRVLSSPCGRDQQRVRWPPRLVRHVALVRDRGEVTSLVISTAGAKPLSVPAIATVLWVLSACGATGSGSTPTPSATRPPATAAVPTVTATPQGAVPPSTVLLTVNDFPPGAVDETAPGLIPPACSPSAPTNFVQSADFEVTDFAGANWTNLVFAFDAPTDAHAFATTFFTAAMQQCATGSGAALDTLGDYSFVYTQKGYSSGPGYATVEVVQVKYLVTMVLDGPNIGPYPPSSELRPLVQTSVAKLESATG
jgi:hypothetical protein